MSVHFTCPAKRHEDSWMAQHGIKSAQCWGHYGPCQTLGERRPNRAYTTKNEERTTKPLKETSDMELVALAARYNLNTHTLHNIAEGD